MEKDFNKEASKSDNSLADNAEYQELSIIDMEMILAAKQESLKLEIEKVQQQSENNMKAIEYLEDLLQQSQSTVSQFQTSPFVCPISPIGSPSHKYQDLFEGRFEDLPDSTVLEGSLRQPNVVSCDSFKVLAKHSVNISDSLQSLEANLKNLEKLSFHSPLKTSDNVTKAAETDIKFHSPPDLEIIGIEAESSRNSGGKGKEAANKKYRYKKRSKTNISSGESLVEDSPVKNTEDGSSIQESTDRGLLLPKAELTKISPVVKRKASEISEKNPDKQQLYESCARTSVITNLSRNQAYGALKMAKKLKSENVEKVSTQYPSITALLLQMGHGNIDLEQIKDQPQTDQNQDKNEECNLPSTSGLSNLVTSISNSEESSLASESDDVLLREGVRSPSSIKKMLIIDEREPFLASGSDDVFFTEGEQSPSSIRDMLFADGGEPFLASVRDLVFTERKESSLTSVSEDTSISESSES